MEIFRGFGGVQLDTDEFKKIVDEGLLPELVDIVYELGGELHLDPGDESNLTVEDVINELMEYDSELLENEEDIKVLDVLWRLGY